jgi:hypothetical protein
MSIQFDLVHKSCPELYDIYNDKGLIGHVRLRYGILSVYINNERIYKHTFSFPFKGEFADDNERKQYLDEIKALL